MDEWQSVYEALEAADRDYCYTEDSHHCEGQIMVGSLIAELKRRGWTRNEGAQDGPGRNTA